ncbi:transcriptional regulator, GntR family [Virgibacillus subterraneus]|uniref:Transcriptional regulator, GntR family n=2 Tax=Virgibacillus TaxID=84406 RepID=A0A1H0Z3X0_9BACI|nr:MULTISPECIES: GntR family transcriptional regulator [Virgibacillus]SDQ22088.1 transcriptional regulator, GntR family [Virgibacillus salinus]SEP86606.1 transcriptional regulator, GntR family [Virgibacillus subterraneus]
MKKETKQHKVYRVIKSRIIERLYVPGQRIVIDQIAKELETSTIPVREAIRQLESERLIFYKQNVGPVVAEVNETDYSDTLRVLAVLEGHATALSAESFPKEKLHILKNLNKKMEEALEEFDILEFGRLNSEFHRVICEECNNNYLLESIKDTWNRLDSIRGLGSTLYSLRVKESIKEHYEIIRFFELGGSFAEVEQHSRMHKIKTAKDFEHRRLKHLEANNPV